MSAEASSSTARQGKKKSKAAAASANDGEAGEEVSKNKKHRKDKRELQLALALEIGQTLTCSVGYGRCRSVSPLSLTSHWIRLSFMPLRSRRVEELSSHHQLEDRPLPRPSQDLPHPLHRRILFRHPLPQIPRTLPPIHLVVHHLSARSGRVGM